MSGHARRTFGDYKRQVLHALGNPAEADLDIEPGAIVNDAIEHIAAMHEWRFAKTAEVALDLEKDQTHVALPADFGTLVAITHDLSWANQMIPTTWDHLLNLRRNPIQSWSSGYFYVVQTGNVEEGDEHVGLSLPTLEIWPAPAETTADAIRMVYRRFLRRLEHDDDRPQWPAYMDRPLSLLARGFASTDYDDNPESAYTAEFRTLVADAQYKDGLTAGTMGIPHGATHRRYATTPFGYPDRGIPDPVIGGGGQ